MHCSFCGGVSTVYFHLNGLAFCAACWREQPIPVGAVTVTAASNSAAMFMPGREPPRSTETVLLGSSAGSGALHGSFRACAHCHQQRPVEHLAPVGAGRLVFVCGLCLDELTEALYRDCAKQGVPHWRKKEDRDA